MAWTSLAAANTHTTHAIWSRAFDLCLSSGMELAVNGSRRGGYTAWASGAPFSGRNSSVGAAITLRAWIGCAGSGQRVCLSRVQNVDGRYSVHRVVRVGGGACERLAATTSCIHPDSVPNTPPSPWCVPNYIQCCSEPPPHATRRHSVPIGERCGLPSLWGRAAAARRAATAPARARSHASRPRAARCRAPLPAPG